MENEICTNANALLNEGCDHAVCSICEEAFSLSEEGGISGYYGILPTAFCPFCYSSTVDMVIKTMGFNDIGVLKERIKELKEEEG
jgi:hypothetical protein